MKTNRALIVLVPCLLALGCERRASTDWDADARRNMNAWSVRTWQQDQVAAGVIAQHTLYEHHFVKFGGTLNELGERDVDILARHYKANPGRLSIRRGGADAKLYQQRVDTVVAAMAAAGVDTKRVTIVDEQPGGDGLASEFVVVILKDKMDKPLTRDHDTDAK